MENNEEGLENHDSEELVETSFKNKVNILQNICLTPPKVKQSPKEKLEQMYPGIEEIKTNMTLDISATDDVYLFRIPKNVDPYSLQNLEISLDQKCKINIGEKYTIEPTPIKPLPTLVLSDNCEIINFEGNIIMEKYIKSKKKPKIVVPEKVTVPFPDNLKKRHPLFGSDYKRKIKLGEEVERKLDDAIESLVKTEKRAKKKKHKKIKLEKPEEI